MNMTKTLMIVIMLAPMGALAAGNRFDNKSPIEITSDALEVQQLENTATFTGNVVAIQNDVRLKSDRMVVYYASADEKKEKKKEGEAEKQTIKKIDVEGNVFLSTPEETASGTRGDYNVETQEIHLNDNVVLTRGKNTLKGSQLVYNFETGKSVITGGVTAEGGASAGKQRVRALFVPEDKKKPEPKKPAVKKQP